MELEEIKIRNVQNKEIYDSYMGILRISPELYDKGDNDMDDITPKLNSLYDADGNPRQIELSDSDGNMLGIYFVPKAYRTTLYDGTERDIINITTSIGSLDDENVPSLYVSEMMNIRSTLDIGTGNEDKKRQSGLVIHTKNVASDSNRWLLYPSECPNDARYFNDKNKLGLIDESAVNKYEYVQNILLEKDPSFYEENGLFDGDETVKINGRVLLTKNINEEAIPVMHTRDYVLGAYQGHSIKTSNSSSVSPSINDINSEGWIDSSLYSSIQPHDGDNITKLSWIRIDHLIWETLDQVMKGQIRHYKGRYRQLGYGAISNDESGYGYDSINDVNLNLGEFFGDPNVSAEQNGDLALTPGAQTTPYGFLQENGELLGQDVAPGLIMYNAMPLHRYMFHIMRQRAQNLKSEYDECNKQGVAKDIQTEWKKEISDFNDNELITPYKIMNSSFTNSMTKNFVLCDGRSIKSDEIYNSYPSINTNNRNIFVLNDAGFKCMRNSSNHMVPVYISEDAVSGVYQYLKQTPQLLSPHESAPRIIRGASWDIDNNSYTNVNYDGAGISAASKNYHFSKNQYGGDGSSALDEPSICKPRNYQTGDANTIYNYNFNTVPKSNHTHNVFAVGDEPPYIELKIRQTTSFSGHADVEKYSNDWHGSIMPFPDEDYNSQRGWRITNGFRTDAWLNSNRPIPTGMLWYEYNNPSPYGYPDMTGQVVYTFNGKDKKAQERYSGRNKWWFARASEQEGLNPVTYKGGWNCQWGNYWHRKCARYRVAGKCLGNYNQYFRPELSGAGAYQISVMHDSGSPMGITSLPFEDSRLLGGAEIGSLSKRLWLEKDERRNLLNDKNNISMTHAWDCHRNKPSVKYGADEENIFYINDYIPQTPSVSLLPLMRI